MNTYAKLDPQELLHYFETLYSYPRKRLTSDLRIRHPMFCRDQESLSAAVEAVLDERSPSTRAMHFPNASAGGIVDFGDERDEDRVRFGKDGSPDGSLPHPGTYQPPHSDYSPLGDDGSSLEERRGDALFLRSMIDSYW